MPEGSLQGRIHGVLQNKQYAPRCDYPLYPNTIIHCTQIQLSDLNTYKSQPYKALQPAH